MTLVELFHSYADLWVHFDSVEAFDYGGDSYLPRLDAFDAEAGRQHAAAFRSLAAATEELDLESLDAEMDRTILLGQIRTRLRRIERDRPERTNPILWAHRLNQALQARPGDADTLARIPGWVRAARETLVKPPLFYLQVALDLVADARASLQTEYWWQADKEALSQANGALEAFDRFLRHEVEPDPEPMAGAMGADRVEWHLRNEFLLELTSKDAARHVANRVETLAGRAEAPPPASAPAPASSSPSAVKAVSEIRQRLLPPAWAAAWLRFSAALAPDPGVRAAAAGLNLRQARLGALDLAIQLGEISPVAAAAHLGSIGPDGPERMSSIGALLVAPLTEAATTLLIAEWERLRGRFGGDDRSFLEAIQQHGLLHPALAGWRLGLGG